MNVASAGSITISGVVILQSPRAVDPQKGTRNIVFDANLYIVEGSETVTMALLRYFASNEMASDIQKMTEKPFQRAFIVANVRCPQHLLPLHQKKKKLISEQIASIPPNSIGAFMSDFEASDYAFVGDISQVRISASVFHTLKLTNTFSKLIPFDGDVNMQINPYITVTGNVAKFDAQDRSFTMMPTQYVVLTHTSSAFPIHAHFADSDSKRWGPD
jgi:hypothetical protein